MHLEQDRKRLDSSHLNVFVHAFTTAEEACEGFLFLLDTWNLFTTLTNERSIVESPRNENLLGNGFGDFDCLLLIRLE